MKRIIIVTLFLLATGYFVIIPNLKKSEMVATQAKSAAAQSTREPTVQPTATLDYVATESVLSANAYNSRMTAVSAQETAVNAIAAVQNAEIAAGQLTQQAEQDKIKLANISLTADANQMTQQAQRYAQVALAVTQQAAQFTATAAAPIQAARIAQVASDAKYLDRERQSIIFVRYAAPVVIGLFIIGLVIVVVIKRPSTQAAEEITEPEMRHVTHVQEYETTTIHRIPDPPCSAEAFTEFASRMLSGDSAAINEWEVAGSPFAGTEYRDAVSPWLYSNGTLTRAANNMLVLSKRGERYCSEWLIRHPLLPTDDIYPKGALKPTMNMETMNMEAEGEGSTPSPMSEPFPS